MIIHLSIKMNNQILKSPDVVRRKRNRLVTVLRNEVVHFISGTAKIWNSI